MSFSQNALQHRALLISIRTPQQKEHEAEESLAELARLVTTLGFDVVGSQTQRQASTKRITVLGSGKLSELAKLTASQAAEFDEEEEPTSDTFSTDVDDETLDELAQSELPFKTADVVVFDCDLSPSQLRNVETQLGVEVFDRTGIIIEIFSRHARTRTARLQVEIARLKYLTPRLRESHIGTKERQMGKGAGESALELDRRRVRDQLAELRRELISVQGQMQGRREKRSEHFCVALVGYTNAGKSSMMRALTGSDVLVENKLFATLDTTVRALQPETQPRILISDTVGFIKKLPHDLVASFHSTLEEAHDASLLLYVVDASDPGFRSQLAVVNEVMQEVGVDETPKILILNKSDNLTLQQQGELLEQYPDSIMMSTHNPLHISALHQKIVTISEKDMQDEQILVPYTANGIVGEIRSNMKVLAEEYGADGIAITVRASTIALERLHKLMQQKTK
ncbi:GTPase HflX [Pseudoalteromonas tunicata]|uniref:GTPase HflX n=1 Tax=Pseudoalteromonas tunicata TaxID=314281 RepID=UPI00273F10B4|nr:GTPase HflX [Pseudoalteromonas tunicata]MDP5212610.1 GTPase HflX [Pseudoalteromonas tunicata]